MAICVLDATLLRCGSVYVQSKQLTGRDSGLEGLVEAACAGSTDAFHEIYRRFARAVHGIVLARVGAADAEDLTQEVFLNAYRRLPRVRSAKALPAWLCTIARNVATDWQRQRTRRPAHESLADEHASVAAREPQEQEDDVRDRVLAAIRGLPAAYSETLVMRLVEGLSGPEISERTGLTHGSVRVNLCRGMALLRPLLEEEGLHP